MTVPFWLVAVCLFAAVTLFTAGSPALVPMLEAHASRARQLREELFEFGKSGWDAVWQSFAFAAVFAFSGFAIAGLVMAVPAAAAGWALPLYLLSERAKERHRKLGEQLVDAMQAVVNSLRSGETFIQGLETACREKLLPVPISQEFEIMVREYALGASQHQVLERARERFQNRDFNLICSAIRISVERGGNLTETLERITAFMREVARLRAGIDIKTSGARKTAQVMRYIPFLILAVLYMSDPPGVISMFESIYGNILITLVVAMNVAAYLWTRSILETEI